MSIKLYTSTSGWAPIPTQTTTTSSNAPSPGVPPQEPSSSTQQEITPLIARLLWTEAGNAIPMSITHGQVLVMVGRLDQYLRAVRLSLCSTKQHRPWQPHPPRPRRAARGQPTLVVPVPAVVVVVAEALGRAAGLVIARGQHVRLTMTAAIHSPVSVGSVLRSQILI